MSHDETHKSGTKEKLVRMANQIGTFFASKPHDEGVAGTAEHINKFWDPRMRRQFFEIVDAGGEGLSPIVMDAVASIRRPNEHVTPAQAAEAEADVSG
jgi:formate dehydrogenase subunit delta